jgi:hypothetical protein
VGDKRKEKSLGTETKIIKSQKDGKGRKQYGGRERKKEK